MKTLATLLGMCTAAALAYTTPAAAQIVDGNDPWNTEQKVALTIAVSAIAIDWLQTRQIAKNPDKFKEYNPVLGKHPSVGEVNVYFAIATGALLLVADFLPSEYRTAVLGGIAFMEVSMVGNNYVHGISVRW